MIPGLTEITEEDITTKTQFVAALRRFLATGKTTTPYHHDEYSPSRGELLLIDAIARYFEDHTEIDDQELGLNWFCDLKKHLVDAFEEFRTHPKHQVLRETYKSQMGGVWPEGIPDLLDVRGSFGWQHVTRDLVELLPLIAGRCGGAWLKRDLDGYFHAEAEVINHAWRRFIRCCYRPFAPQLKQVQHRGNSGLFGRTTLRSYGTAGRVMFTFARTEAPSDVLAKVTELVNTEGVTAENKVAALEALLMIVPSPDSGPDAQQITFVADDSDLYGFRSGMNFPDVGYAKCVEMINDVIDHWDPAKFVVDSDVTLG